VPKKEVWEHPFHAFPPHCTIDFGIDQKPSHAKRSNGSRNPHRQTRLPITYSVTALKLQD